METAININLGPRGGQVGSCSGATFPELLFHVRFILSHPWFRNNPGTSAPVADKQVLPVLGRSLQE